MEKEHKTNPLPLVPVNADSTTEITETPEELSQDDQLIKNYLMCRDWYQAGIAAGYSESYSRTKLKYVKLRNPKFVEKIKKAYESHQAESLLDIAEIQKHQLKATLKNPELYKITRHTAKEIKQELGILKPDHDQSRPLMVNIKELRNMMIQVHEKGS